MSITINAQLTGEPMAYTLQEEWPESMLALADGAKQPTEKT